MNTLAIDTTSRNLNLCLLSGEARYSILLETGKGGHSKLLMTSVDKLLSEAQLKPNEIDTVAAVIGPGSFTGIRIGVAAATALAFANGAKRISVTSFEIIAYNRSKITAAIDAGHGNLYIAECENGKVLSTDFLQSDEVEKLKAEGRQFVSEPISALDLTMSCVVENKIKNSDYVNVFQPFYLRKPQAERAKECAD